VGQLLLSCFDGILDKVVVVVETSTCMCSIVVVIVVVVKTINLCRMIIHNKLLLLEHMKPNHARHGVAV